MENEHQERSVAMENLAKVLNAGGRAAVATYDATVSAFGKLITLVKKTPALTEKTKGMFTKGLGFIKPGEIGQLEKKIRDYEKQIKELYFEIGKEGSKCSEGENPLEAESVKKLVSDVREYEKDIDRMKRRIAEINEEKMAQSLKMKEEKKAAKVAKLNEKAKKDKVTDEEIIKIVELSINKAVKNGEFDSLSEQEIFSKVSRDLLDSEIEIKCLAAAELGKMKNVAAVSMLMEAAKFENHDLTSEIINSLIAIGDEKAVSLFKEQVKSPKYAVRIGCLRGLYKLAENEVALPILIDSLRDDHPEVRRTSLTFIGWKDYTSAVPSVIQCLRDEEPRVRKAAVSSLANIKDQSSVLPLITLLGDQDLETREKAFDAIKVISQEDIKFDVHASGKDLAEAIKNLKDWWQRERLGKTDMTESQYSTEPESVAEVEKVEEENKVFKEEPKEALEKKAAVEEGNEPETVEEKVPEDVVVESVEAKVPEDEAVKEEIMEQKLPEEVQNIENPIQENVQDIENQSQGENLVTEAEESEKVQEPKENVEL